MDIRKLETLAQNDADAYSYSGGLNRANQGILEFVEMFKAPIKMLHPLLTATQEGNYVGTENIGAIPFSGVILAHSNEASGKASKPTRNNEAFIDRIYLIKVPYCLRATEEQKIYDKLIRGSSWRSAVCASDAGNARALFGVVPSAAHENSTFFSKLRVYDGESLRETDPRARSLQEYRDAAGRTKAWTASRPASRSRCSRNLQPRFSGSRRRPGPPDVCAGAGDPSRAVQRRHEKRLLEHIKGDLAPRYAEFIGHEIQKAYLESYTITDRIFSTVMSTMRTHGSKTKTSRTRTLGR